MRGLLTASTRGLPKASISRDICFEAELCVGASNLSRGIITGPHKGFVAVYLAPRNRVRRQYKSSRHVFRPSPINCLFDLAVCIVVDLMRVMCLIWAAYSRYYIAPNIKMQPEKKYIEHPMTSSPAAIYRVGHAWQGSE